MYDWNNGGYIDEVLRADGGSMPSQLPLLDNHSRYSALSVVGSAREIKPKNGEIVGRVYFAENVGRSEDIYQLVRQGHLTDVSVGYSYGAGDYVDIQRGQTAKIGTKTYTASAERTMRVVTRWSGRELSVTPIGADQLAKMRSLSDCKFGQGDATEEILNSSLKQAEQLPNERQDSRTMSTVATTETSPNTGAEQTIAGDRSATNQVDITARKAEIEAAVELARKQEFERIEHARSFAGKVQPEVIERSIKERWDVSKMNSEFLNSLTTRSEPVGNQAPAGHVADNEIRKEHIEALFLARAGINLEGGHFGSRCHQLTFSRGQYEGRDMRWAVRAAQTLDRGSGNLEPVAEKAVEFANSRSSMHLIEICRMALDTKGIQYDRYDERDIATRMLTTQSVMPLLTNALGAMILEGFMGTEDTTGWCPSVEVPNDNPQPVAKVGQMSRLKKRKTGEVPVGGAREATEEFVSVATYSEQYFLDRKDLLADRFGVINNGPQQLGEAAREIIMDLVYAVFLLNPNVQGSALFSTARGNLGLNAGLSFDSLGARKNAMATQTNNSRLIGGVRMETLLVPDVLEFLAMELMGSSEKRDTTAATKYGTMNALKGKYKVIAEPRLDVGCVNPDTGNVVAGRPNDFYGIAQGGKYGLVKAFLKSLGGGPVVESWSPGDGRIGVGTTVELEAGVKAVAWEGLQCGTSAASK